MPEGHSDDVVVLDCRCINDFCSIVGDILVGDLKDENGKPYYRLINPVGRLLMDFRTVDEEVFNKIVEEWYSILEYLLHKGEQEEYFTIEFPKQYLDWLEKNEYFENIVRELRNNNCIIKILTKEIFNDVVTPICYRINNILQSRKDCFSFVVFSSQVINNSSFFTSKLGIDGLGLLRYESWKEIVKNEINTKVIEIKDDIVEVTVDDIKINMIYVKGGEFLMGPTTEQKVAHDFNYVHPVTLSDFYICETLVTQKLWKKIMGDKTFFLKSGNDLPANISWNESQEFIFKLNRFTEKKFRLPTEAEWEYAARGGIKSKYFRFAGSNNLDEVAWHDGELHPVAQLKPNELGLYDMCGNAPEHCQDWYDEYSLFPEINPSGPIKPISPKHLHVYRGGCGSYDDNYNISRRFSYDIKDTLAAIRLVIDL